MPEQKPLDATFIHDYVRRYEHDACALICGLAKGGTPVVGLTTEVIAALTQMAHRSGDVDGEGDGCGLQTDLPRVLWSERLRAAGQEPNLAYSAHFAVGHFFIPASEAYWARELKDEICRRFSAADLTVLLSLDGPVEPAALGPRAATDAPLFWQVAVTVPQGGPAADRLLFRLALAVEEDTPIHVVSFSTETVVYKVRGGPEILEAYYPDLHHPGYACRSVIGHNRYSTNTTTIFERVQPFSLLGHNGEINTIRQLREQAALLGIPLTRGGSDSQDMNRTLEGLIHHCGLSLMEAAELLFPPMINEIKQYPQPLQDLHMYYRQAFGPFAQGPAAVAARFRDECIFSVDAMGLRPLWLVETADRFFFSSEQGIVAASAMVADPKPLGPGEKVGALLLPSGTVLLSYTEMQRRVLTLSRGRFPTPDGWSRFIETGGPLEDSGWLAGAEGTGVAYQGPQEKLLAAMGWSGEDQQQVRAEAQTGAEPIGSLGFDGALACLGEHRQNLADYFKESVAVVTNPAIDREREIEHFSTRAVVGVRPPVAVLGAGDRVLQLRSRVELRVPVVLGGHAGPVPIGRSEYRKLANHHGTYLLEDLTQLWGSATGASHDPGAVQHLEMVFTPTESLAQALQRLQRQAVQAVVQGSELLVLDDRQAFSDERLWIDPHLALSAVDLALKRYKSGVGQANLRRRCSLVLRSGALRNLHDLMLALGLGADALAPYLMFEVAAMDGAAGVDHLISSLNKGFEKVISTLGIHELRGYARLFASIGLKPEVARFFGCENFYGSERGGVGLGRLKADAGERYHVYNGDAHPKIARPFRVWPRVWKIAGDAALGKAAYRDFADKLLMIEKEAPVSLRHLLDLRSAARPVPVERVDTAIGDYRYPLTISGMSFGSQGEIAFRAYAEAAKRLDIIAMNGEGGEIPDMVGRYWKWRGQQVASGRFGVHAEMLAGSRFMEIKVGQGAKPGEGGHLPGKKVSEKVARARNATPGSDLISPSNNHDIYSIEDLAQLVDELKTVNPQGKVVVKVPVVPGIGTIAVGVAKSGADIIALCGYDGGTGAARRHALRHAGLPVEIGVREAHMALTAAGIRDRVEVWGDSGIKSGLDVIKLMLLGANRVGFGTLAMVSIGCTICRGCQLDTCHVGIATQIESVEQARHHGLKHFVPRVYDEAVDRLVNLFTAIGGEVQELTARLGFDRTQDLVGRSELLVQTRDLGRVDLTELTAPLPANLEPAEVGGGGVRKVGNPLTREIAAVSTGRLALGQQEFRHLVPLASARDRSLGTSLAGDLARGRLQGGAGEPPSVSVIFGAGSIPGNGFGAFNVAGQRLVALGGAQDGVGKGMLGGEVIVLKSANDQGRLMGGCVGKSFAYGAQRGLFIVQGDADARFGIRLSGADVILGGGLRGPVNDSQGGIATRANIKGFAFEYMTQGRAVVLGDPGPWMCSGMTGGVLYCRVDPEKGMDEAALRRRLAKGSKANIVPIGPGGKKDLTELLSAYHQVLLDSGQDQEASGVLTLLLDCERHFVAVTPVMLQADQTISTE